MKEEPTEDLSKSLMEYENLEKQLEVVLIQKHQLQIQLNEIKHALEELKKAKGEVYRSVGSIIMSTSSEEAQKDLNERQELIDVKLNALGKQEEKLRSTVLDSQKERAMAKNEGVFGGFLSRYGSNRLAIATHSRADVDALASAYVLSKHLPESVICTIDEMGEGARMLSEKLSIDVQDISALERTSFRGLVVADTSTYTLLPQAREWEVLLIIDHHRAEGRDMKGEFEIIEPESPSTAEIIANIIPDLDKDSAFALSVGIIADAARFKSARAQSFETLARLMKIADADYSELLSYAEPEPKAEAKLAMLSAMKRVEFVYSAGYIIATSEASSNESDAASLLAEAADVAFVANWKNEEQESRISARARKDVAVPLNKVMAEVGQALGGAGGGHPKAAGASAKAHTDETLKKCVDVFISMASG
jgi:prefoldin beta subunit